MELPTVSYVFDRRHIATNIKTAAIELRITYKSRQKYLATGIRVKKNQWKNGQIVGSLECIELNRSLDIFKNKVWSIINKMIDEDDGVNLNMVSDMLHQNKKTSMSFIDYVWSRIKSKPSASGTHKHYISFAHFLENWGKIVWFSDLTESNIRRMDEYLNIAKGLKENTRYNYHKHLKMFINDAIVDGLIDKNPYTGVKISRGSSDGDKYLSIEELKLIENLSPATESLQKVKDLFLMQCYTGLGYADLMIFDKKSIIDGKIKLYKGNRVKTGIAFTTILAKEAVEILEKYNYTLPKMSNNQYNLRIKVLADACGIDKPVSSHWARRTTGMIMLNRGIPIEVVSKVLGHSNTLVTQKAYAKILDKTIEDTFKDW